MGSPRGRVLIAYILEPFLLGPGAPVPSAHTHYRESLLMAQAWQDLGYAVDVIDYRNHEFVPSKHYDFFVSARTYLETIAKRLPENCVKIAHLDTSHYAFNNHASYERLLALQQRRRMVLPGSLRLIEHNRAIEVADYGVVLGNSNTVDTYRYAGKPLLAMPALALVSHLPGERKDFDTARNHFLWFGSGSLVHKGLDLVLEAVSDMPEVQLTVCGPIDSEAPFKEEYRKELSQADNITVVGWVDIEGEAFREILDQCAAVVYPSCAEGQATSVLNCMHAGVIPIVTPETGISVDDFGLTLSHPSVDSIRHAMRSIVMLPGYELRERSNRTSQYTVEHHSQEAYLREYRNVIETILMEAGKQR